MIDIENYADRTCLFDVRVLDGADSELSQYNGEVSNEELVFEVFRGVPETIHVRVNDGPEVRFDWPTIECDDAGPAPKAEVEYGATTGTDEVHIQSHCGPVTMADS